MLSNANENTMEINVQYDEIVQNLINDTKVIHDFCNQLYDNYVINNKQNQSVKSLFHILQFKKSKQEIVNILTNNTDLLVLLYFIEQINVKNDIGSFLNFTYQSFLFSLFKKIVNEDNFVFMEQRASSLLIDTTNCLLEIKQLVVIINRLINSGVNVQRLSSTNKSFIELLDLTIEVLQEINAKMNLIAAINEASKYQSSDFDLSKFVGFVIENKQINSSIYQYFIKNPIAKPIIVNDLILDEMQNKHFISYLKSHNYFVIDNYVEKNTTVLDDVEMFYVVIGFNQKTLNSKAPFGFYAMPLNNVLNKYITDKNNDFEIVNCIPVNINSFKALQFKLTLLNLVLDVSNGFKITDYKHILFDVKSKNKTETGNKLYIDNLFFHEFLKMKK